MRKPFIILQKTMVSSSFTKMFIIAIPLIYSSGAIAVEDNMSKNKSSSALKSLLPISTQQSNEINLLRSKRIIDSTNQWDTREATELVLGGGYGGNKKIGMLMYDGLPSHASAFFIKRNNEEKKCYLENQDGSIYHANFFGSLKVVSYKCNLPDERHHDVYWNETLKKRNGGYSPDNDALYGLMMVNKMYEDWFGLQAIKNTDGSPIKVITHERWDNALFNEDKKTITLGDGDKLYYPLTSPGLVSFMAGFIFTAQYSKLDLNQATSMSIAIAYNAMADQAIKFYMTGQNDWQVGYEISKTTKPLYYLDRPSKDCDFHSVGAHCSIDHMSQYDPNLDPHHSSGIYRRALYLLSTTPGWDVKKTFGLLVQANRFHWSSRLNFSQGVCGLVKAAQDLQYETAEVTAAFEQVGVKSSC